ncbi:MAG: abortive infection family protein [Bryobacteraceae bacterium]
MTESLLSKKVLYEFEDLFASWTLREISAEFDAVDIPRHTTFVPRVSGQRRSLVQQYYHSLDLASPKDIAKLQGLFQNVLSRLEQLETGDYDDDVKAQAARNFSNLTQWLRKDGFEYRDGALISTRRKLPVLPHIKGIAIAMDSAYLQQQIRRMEEAVENDPWLAIGTAKEFVETICKTILSARGVPINEKWDLMELSKQVRKEVKLLPDDIPDAAKASDTVKRLLSNLATIVQGLGELRNPYGTGHGRDAGSKGLRPRHARLAVGAAATLATFLFETHNERQ